MSRMRKLTVREGATFFRMRGKRVDVNSVVRAGDTVTLDLDSDIFKASVLNSLNGVMVL